MRVGVFDVESDGFLDEATQAWCIVVKDIETGRVHEWSGEEKMWLGMASLNHFDVLIGHNCIAYDFPLLKKLYGWEFKGKVVDTLLMSRLQRPNLVTPYNCPNRGARPHSVEAWGYRLGRGKVAHEEWDRYSPEMLHRCVEDVEIQHLIYKELLKDAGWREANMLTFSLFSILQKQEERGWLVDRGHLDNSIHMLTHWMDRIDKVLLPTLPMVLEVIDKKVKGVYGWIKKPYKKCGDPMAALATWLADVGHPADSHIVGGPFTRVLYRTVDLDKSVEVKDYLLREGWIPEKWNTNDSGERTSPKLSKDDHFNGIVSSRGRLIAKRVQCKQRRGILNGWVDRVRADGSIPTPVSELAVTRRLKHKLVVNVPGGDAFFGKWMRKVFTVREGWTIVGIDSAGCQNRMLGARVGNPEYTHTLLNGDKAKGTSIHQLNQKAIQQMTGLDCSYHNAKTINYGFLFGARDPRLGSVLNAGKEVGAKIREAMLGVAPGFEELLAKLTTEWRGNAKTRKGKYGLEYYEGWIAGLDGRPIHIPYEYQILVYTLQSDEAIMMTKAYTLMYERMVERGYTWGEDWAYLIFYHDEYNIECRPEIAEEVGELGAQCITDAGEYYNIACPHEGEAKIGSNWYEVH